MSDTKTANEAKISVKLIIDKMKKRVVYAEADHTFVDLLFSFMTLPMGTIVRILGKHSDKKLHSVGSLNNLYQSLKDLPDCYMSTDECKCILLHPRSLSFDRSRNLKLKLDDTAPLKYFQCASCASGIRFCMVLSTCNKAKCDSCGNFMKREYRCIHNASVSDNDGGVFVSGTATFIVTDDLCVMPYTSANSIQLLINCGITEKSRLEDIKFDLDCDQMLSLLKAALSLDYVFTNLVFAKSKYCLVVPCQSLTSDQIDITKKEEVSSSKFFLEVFLQKSTGKLLFAEANEDFVDFLFGMLSIPLGTVIGNLLNGASSVSCMDNIFKSISNMSVGRYLKSQDVKDRLLKPHIAQQFSSINQIFPLKGTPFHFEDHVFYSPMLNGGLLKQSGMFIVTDDLIITPSSSGSTINTLNDLKVSFDDIEKHEISVGLVEGLRMLKAALKSSSTLADSLEHQLKKRT